METQLKTSTKFVETLACQRKSDVDKLLARKEAKAWKLDPLTPVLPITALPLLTSSLLTKIGIIDTQLLQEEKIFPMMPRSEWSARGSLRYMYAQKCSISLAKNSDQNFLPLNTWLLHGKNCLSRWRSLRSFLTASKPSRRSITAAKRKGEKGKAKKKIPKIEKPYDVGHFLIKKLKISKFWFLRMPGSKCPKMRS